MIKGILATVLVAGVTATGATASLPNAPTTDRDVVSGAGRNVAVARTAASKVDTAIARRNRASSRGHFRITCTKGNQTWTSSSWFFGRVRILSNLGGLKDPSCHLTVRVISHNGHRAIATATLLGDN